ncbi:NUDIX hydrolase [Candidatus Roizmanbacteria bacterium CG_4_10_14_0_8_um_filter_39_9]|uniref:NUDIX hydrolase n=1 Tax=Candidatus Roizmanbacteria bacterium CG_4_10_14_0_8_um_filter_39_9 TaxID=1974829 RepID=A0A2M7QFJ2_9BACT|nr:MAG: NUDIX hydrolase [Candidatus Roizmanbacteria bacterium CG_4_10_14_0_8_um_filter_39_9]
MQTTDDQKELFIVVDEQDNIKEFRTRGECHQNRNLIHRAVDVVLFNTKGEIAFQKRSMTKDTSPGFYSISASGHVSKGESYLQAAVREMEEEIGVRSIKLEYVATQLAESPKEKEMFMLFKGTYDGNFKINKDEVEGVYYFNKSQMAKIKKCITPCSLASLKILGWL